MVHEARLLHLVERAVALRLERQRDRDAVEPSVAVGVHERRLVDEQHARTGHERGGDVELELRDEVVVDVLDAACGKRRVERVAMVDGDAEDQSVVIRELGEPVHQGTGCASPNVRWCWSRASATASMSVTSATGTSHDAS